jgi:hypothetical protein
MPDNKNDKGQRDRSRVAADQDFEINYLVEKTGASREEIEQAIKEVGNSREKVEAFLKNKNNR